MVNKWTAEERNELSKYDGKKIAEIRSAFKRRSASSIHYMASLVGITIHNDKSNKNDINHNGAPCLLFMDKSDMVKHKLVKNL